MTFEKQNKIHMKKLFYFSAMALAVSLFIYSCEKEVGDEQHSLSKEDDISTKYGNPNSIDDFSDMNYREAIIHVEHISNKEGSLEKQSELFLDTFSVDINIERLGSDLIISGEEQSLLHDRVEGLKQEFETSRKREVLLVDLILKEINSEGKHLFKILFLSQRSNRIFIANWCAPKEDLIWSDINQTCTGEDYHLSGAKQVEGMMWCALMRQVGHEAFDLETVEYYTSNTNDPNLFGFNSCISEDENLWGACVTKEEMKDLTENGIEFFRENAPLDENGEKKEVINVVIYPYLVMCGCDNPCVDIDRFWGYYVTYGEIRITGGLGTNIIRN